jgi:hypothetical protein
MRPLSSRSILSSESYPSIDGVHVLSYVSDSLSSYNSTGTSLEDSMASWDLLLSLLSSGELKVLLLIN